MFRRRKMKKKFGLITIISISVTLLFFIVTYIITKIGPEPYLDYTGGEITKLELSEGNMDTISFETSGVDVIKGDEIEIENSTSLYIVDPFDEEKLTNVNVGELKIKITPCNNTLDDNCIKGIPSVIFHSPMYIGYMETTSLEDLHLYYGLLKIKTPTLKTHLNTDKDEMAIQLNNNAKFYLNGKLIKAGALRVKKNEQFLSFLIESHSKNSFLFTEVNDLNLKGNVEAFNAEAQKKADISLMQFSWYKKTQDATRDTVNAMSKQKVDLNYEDNDLEIKGHVETAAVNSFNLISLFPKWLSQSYVFLISTFISSFLAAWISYLFGKKAGNTGE